MTAFFPDEDQTDVPPGLTAAVNRLCLQIRPRAMRERYVRRSRI